jgi:hypothetical protein
MTNDEIRTKSPKIRMNNDEIEQIRNSQSQDPGRFGSEILYSISSSSKGCAARRTGRDIDSYGSNMTGQIVAAR